MCVLLFAACGGDDDGDAGVRDVGGTDEAVEVLAEGFAEGGDANGLAFDASEADCVARAVADGIATDRLQELGLNTTSGDMPELHEPPLTTSEADIVYGAYDGCTDLTVAVAVLLGPSESGADPQCVAQRYVDSGLLRESLFSADFDQALNDRIDAALADANTACAQP
jgi:hypothetical protein